MEGKLLKHLYRYQKWYILLLVLILLMTPLISNLLQSKPLIMGIESYFHLTSAENVKINTSYFPLHFLNNSLGNDALVLIPILLALGSILLYLQLARKLGVSNLFSLFFLLFLIFSPAFIFTFSTISANSYFIFLILSGFLIIAQKRRNFRYLAIIPFVMAAFFDIFSTLLLLTLQSIYFYHSKEKQIKLTLVIISTTVLLLLTNLFLMHKKFVLGPFHVQQSITDLITDLGGLSGISFFLLFLALIGLVVARKQKEIYGAYLLTFILIPVYIYNTQIIFFLSIIAAFFATISFLKIFEKKWVLDTLRKFTLLLLILGIVFSTFTYLDRINLNGPSAEEGVSLEWIKKNTANNAIIFSGPENKYYIEYLAKRTTFSDPEISDSIFTATYINELFPLLEDNDIKILYITKKMKEQLSVDYGLLFLLKNEKFKLVHSQGETEVWAFRK